MTLPSDPPLPPWPVHDIADHEWQQYDTDVIAYWEPRCRAAVEALDNLSRRGDPFDTYCKRIVGKALALIGPLPTQEGDTK